MEDDEGRNQKMNLYFSSQASSDVSKQKNLAYKS
jgi:hypothetical protein